ncbi:sugar-transfer associated ATP-grasp domain-containing protein [Acinetobacter indicus]|uniref:sugar-transfer associated ATP-grasp domain-containing protein n=1 Tax=Acinetobacter indicus TaxID=756892 RepID=UPI002576ED18|nr:sugar-transfer associated ATP-grasp domain-containing protein [Acinetobacter indicus]MDM1286211.1 hypothetical protein [Acinetobacter indicus]
MENFKKTFRFLKDKYTLFARTSAFKKRYKNIDQSLFNRTLDQSHLNNYIKRWNVFGEKVEVETFLLCYNLSGIIDYNIVPENFFAAIIEPKLNSYKGEQLSFLAVKNIYSRWFKEDNVFPKNYFNKIDGVYYDGQLNLIDNINKYLEGSNFEYPLICKPSLGTAGGVGVKILKNLDEVKSNLDYYENLVFQEKIKQNKILERINPGMNSIRTCLYRTNSGKFKVINNSIRFGVDGSMDNETAGGLVCSINNDGTLNKYAVKKYCEKFFSHPNSGIKFSEAIIPYYNSLSEVAESIANQIPLCNLVSLDMCLDSHNRWRCLEINLASQTIRFAQYAGKPFFGEFTEEVISHIVDKK